MVVVIDPQIAGISGDMLLSSLIDLGADKGKVIDGIKKSENFYQIQLYEKLICKNSKKRHPSAFN